MGVQVPLISAVAFIATKLTAFADRGRDDYYGSHDLEDVIAVIDGRASIVRDVETAAHALGAYVTGKINELIKEPEFQEALAGHLPSDSASQGRLPILRARLNKIAAGNAPYAYQRRLASSARSVPSCPRLT